MYTYTHYSILTPPKSYPNYRVKRTGSPFCLRPRRPAEGPLPGLPKAWTVRAAMTHLPLLGKAQTRKEINATFQRKLCGERLQQGRSAGPRSAWPGTPGLRSRPPRAARDRSDTAQCSRRKRTPHGRERAPALGTEPPGAAPSPRVSVRAGPGRHGAAPSREAQNATPEHSHPHAPFLPGPAPSLPGLARGCHLGPARASSDPGFPKARQRAAFKSPGYSVGGESMRAGAARRGAGRGGSEVGGAGRGLRGGAGPQGKRAGGGVAVSFLVAAGRAAPAWLPDCPVII